MSIRNPMPTTNTLLNYLKHSKWHNITANFAGFVKKEFDTVTDRLGDRDGRYRNLQMLIQLSELGNYSEARDIIDKATRDYDDIIRALTEEHMFKTQRRAHDAHVQQAAPHNGEVRQSYSPVKGEAITPQKAYTPDLQNRQTPRGQNNPDNIERGPRTPVIENGPDTNRPQMGSSQRQIDPSEGRNPRPTLKEVVTYHKEDMGMPPYEGNMTGRSPRSPSKNDDSYQRYDTNRPPSDAPRDDRSNPRTPMREVDGYFGQMPEGSQPDPHRVNFDNLRLKSPEQRPSTNLSYRSAREPDVRPIVKAANMNQVSQMTSHAELWGLDHGDRAVEKLGDSTYRQSFHAHSVSTHDRSDRDRYRENFAQILDSTEELHRFINTPEHDENRPSELSKRFKDLYLNEWRDAYDEIVKNFGAEKTARHLLWIITESAKIATKIADVQLQNLQAETVRVMTTNVKEAWLICLDIADKQLKDLEKSAMGIMETPGPEHPHGDRGNSSRHMGNTLPTSKKLLLKYRRQTAGLSIPYIREECMGKICRTLMESSGVPKHALNNASRLVAYIRKGAELVWLMSVQDPPIVLEYINKETEGARYNEKHYHPLTRPGKTYAYGVWPMLRQGRGGPIISLGVAHLS